MQVWLAGIIAQLQAKTRKTCTVSVPSMRHIHHMSSLEFTHLQAACLSPVML